MKIRNRTQQGHRQIKLDIIRSRGGRCKDCHVDLREHPECADFDHVQGYKLVNVSTLINRISLTIEAGRISDELQNELTKCDLVCANCHRIRTVNRTAADKVPDPAHPWVSAVDRIVAASIDP